MTVSPRETASGPSRVAAAIPDSNAVLPLPRATDRAADWTPGRKALTTNLRCQGRTLNVWPARRPCETVRSDR